MIRVEVQSTVGADGILSLSIPLGVAEANKSVTVVVEPAKTEALCVAWQRFITETAGSISDPTFKRQAQGEYEQRELL